MTVFISAQPVLIQAHEGFAIWRVVDIPSNVPRGLSASTVAEAVRLWRTFEVWRVFWGPADTYAAVAWDALQPELGAAPSLADTYNGKRLPDTFSLAACTGEQIDRRSVSPEARAAWSAELRQLQHEARERARLQVLVDLDVEPWE